MLGGANGLVGEVRGEPAAPPERPLQRVVVHDEVVCDHFVAGVVSSGDGADDRLVGLDGCGCGYVDVRGRLYRPAPTLMRQANGCAPDVMYLVDGAGEGGERAGTGAAEKDVAECPELFVSASVIDVGRETRSGSRAPSPSMTPELRG